MQTLSASGIRYLIAMHSLSNESGVRCVDIAQTLHVSKPSVHRMMITLSNKAFVQREKYGTVFLTEKGLQLATRYTSYYIIIFQFFNRKLAVPREDSRNAAFALFVGITEEHIESMCKIMKAAF